MTLPFLFPAIEGNSAQDFFLHTRFITIVYMFVCRETASMYKLEHSLPSFGISLELSQRLYDFKWHLNTVYPLPTPGQFLHVLTQPTTVYHSNS